MKEIEEYIIILLDRLHEIIKEDNIIKDGRIEFIDYDITIDVTIAQLERKNSVLCTLYFYVDAPLFNDIFFECSTGLSSSEEKAIFLASDNFVFCALNGILEFFTGVYHYEIETFLAKEKKKFTVCESTMIRLANREYRYNYEDGERNGHSSFFWNIIKNDLQFRLGNSRVYYLKAYGVKMPNGEVIGELRINDIPSLELGNLISNEVEKWDNNGEFISFKQFFFILQDETTYVPYPYSKDEVAYFVNEAVLEFEKYYIDYEEYKENLKKIIHDVNIVEEIINFIPEICAQNAFGEANYEEKILIFLGDEKYKLYRNQFTSYYLIEEAVFDGFRDGRFKKETYNNFIRLSSIYKVICEARKENENIKISDINISMAIRFSDKYKLR